MIVVKIGGAAGVDTQAACADAALCLQEGHRLVLVHGGSAEASALGEALGHPPRFVTSPSGFTSRYTDERTLEVFSMAVNGGINTSLVSQLRRLGVNALGLSGLDGGLARAGRKAAIRVVENGKQKRLHGDFTGKIGAVDAGLLRLLLGAGYTPVIAPLAAGKDGEALNTDADRMAAMVAAALGAESLLLLTAAPGLLRDFPDESSLIPRLHRDQLDEALQLAEGRMKKKVLGAAEALEGGVRRVIIGDGRIANPIRTALDGAGTMIEAGH
ncbi:MAG: [LysW]-aminoadipate kinase [Anaerolineales bacterium]|nr:[LysW]-aminoadipate kinase [Anaerolineales bacterium]